jgi:hypothetical protein
MNSRFVRAAVLAAIVVGGLGAVPIAANAGSNLCPSARACIYVDPQWIGLLGYRSGGLGIINVTGGADNKTSSWENKTTSHAAWYTLSNGSGSCYNMRSGAELSSIPWPNYDKLSSWKTNGLC